MNLKYTGILTAFAVSAVMAQNEAPAPAAEAAPVQVEQAVEQAPAPAEDKFTQVEKELCPWQD